MINYGLYVFIFLSLSYVLISLHNSCGTVVWFSSFQRSSCIISMTSFIFEWLPSYDTAFIGLYLKGVLFLSPCAGLNWCVCPVEVTLAHWNVEKAPHMRGAWESQPLPSGQGPSSQVRTLCHLLKNVGLGDASKDKNCIQVFASFPHIWIYTDFYIFQHLLVSFDSSLKINTLMKWMQNHLHMTF